MSHDTDREEFLVWLATTYPQIASETADRLVLYGELLREASDRKALVARGDRQRVFTRHIRDVLHPRLLDRIPQTARILDVGSGGGLPGVPLAILREDLEVLLLEPRQRKAGFLERAILATGLSSRVRVLAMTVEDLARRGGVDRYDMAVSRALRWTPQMTVSLGRVLGPDAVLVRLGSPASRRIQEGVEIIPVGGDPPRAVQVWTRPSWASICEEEP